MSLFYTEIIVSVRVCASFGIGIVYMVLWVYVMLYW